MDTKTCRMDNFRRPSQEDIEFIPDQECIRRSCTSCRCRCSPLGSRWAAGKSQCDVLERTLIIEWFRRRPLYRLAVILETGVFDSLLLWNPTLLGIRVA